MKTQTQNNLLSFHKNSMVELNDLQLRNTDSGRTDTLTPSVIIYTVIGIGIAITMEITN